LTELDAWLEAVVATPGLTALGDLLEARRVLVEDSLRALDILKTTEGPIVDVGSGGGAPGIPLALALPEREIVLLEASRRKCEFLRRWAPPNARVVQGRAEEQESDWAAAAAAKALAPPPVAAEWCLPLVRSGGLVVLYVGPSADSEHVARVGEKLNAKLEESPQGLLVLRKVGSTPMTFPRRVGVAKKRPLA